MKINISAAGRFLLKSSNIEKKYPPKNLSKQQPNAVQLYYLQTHAILKLDSVKICSFWCVNVLS